MNIQVPFDNNKATLVQGEDIARFLDRFWSKVDFSGDCWLWKCSPDKDGYGRFSALLLGMGKSAFAHRVAYYLVTGIWPKMLCHTCDTPLCVNFFRLYEGTPLDNIRDMDTRGRRANVSGEYNPMAKITWDTVRQVRELASSGLPQRRIAKQLGVHYVSVCLIVNNKQWKEVSLYSAGAN